MRQPAPRQAQPRTRPPEWAAHRSSSPSSASPFYAATRASWPTLLAWVRLALDPVDLRSDACGQVVVTTPLMRLALDIQRREVVLALLGTHLLHISPSMFAASRRS